MPLELQDNQPLEVVLAIFFKKNVSGSHEFFLQKRAKSTERILWEFPGGKIEAGEKKLNALIREIHEELEIDLEQLNSTTIQEFEIFNHTYPQFSVQLHSFLIQHGFEGDGEWFLLDEISNLQFPLIAGSREIVNTLKKHFCE